MHGNEGSKTGVDSTAIPNRFVVTGANGYLGRNICLALLAEGSRVFALSRSDFSKLPESENLTRITFELGRDNPESLRDVLSDSILIDTAWSNGFNHWDRSHLSQASEHLDFLTRAAALGTKKLVGIGSMHEIGRFDGPFREADPLNPENIYGLSKLALLRGQKHISKVTGVPSLWLRCFYFEGQDQENNSILSKVLRASRNQESLTFDSGVGRFDFIDVAVAGRLIASLSSDPDVIGEINIGSGLQTSIREKIIEFVKANDLDIEIHFDASRDADEPVVGCWPDISNLKRLTSDRQ